MGSDFHFSAESQSQFVPSSEAEQSHCHEIAIEDDAILENTEHLEAVLAPPVGVPRLLVGVVRMQVVITDDDTVRVGFTQSQHTVDEDGTDEERALDVCTHMTGEIEREVSVLVTSQPGTASDGERP